MFNYNHLYYFYVTAKLGGVVTPRNICASVSPHSVHNLKFLSRRLTKNSSRKKGRNLELTVEGEHAFAYAKKMFDVAAEFSESLLAPADRRTQKLHIGVSEQVERPFIADLLTPVIRNNRNNTDKTVSITSAPDEEVLELLRTQQVDLMLTNKPIYAEDIKELAAVSAPVNLMVATQNLKQLKIRVSKNTTAQDFLNATPWGLVIPSYKMKLRHETDLFIQEIKIRKKISFESDIMSVVGRAISDGAGVGFLPVPYVMEEIKMGLVTAIGPKTGYWKHSLYLLTRKDANQDDMVDDLQVRFKQLDRWL